MIIEYAPYLAKKNIILASQSPRRREILNMLQLPFTIQVSTFEETLPKASFDTPAEYAKANACGKAREVASRFRESDLVIGSDTIVVLDGSILEKPKSEAESYSMLKRLSGRSHTVISAVAMFGGGGGEGDPLKSFVETATVTFAELSDDTIQAYIRTGEPADKAGSYGIQCIGGSFVSKVRPTPRAVVCLKWGLEVASEQMMGIPMHRVALAIRELIESRAL